MDESKKVDLLSTTDARVWAEEFNKSGQKLGYPSMDEGWLIAWFANAMFAQEVKNMRGKEMPNVLEDIEKEALGLAAQCWCDPETSHKQMDPDLAKAFAKRLMVLLGCSTLAQVAGGSAKG